MFLLLLVKLNTFKMVFGSLYFLLCEFSVCIFYSVFCPVIFFLLTCVSAGMFGAIITDCLVIGGLHLLFTIFYNTTWRQGIPALGGGLGILAQILFLLCCSQLVLLGFHDGCHSSSHHILDNCLQSPPKLPQPKKASLLIIGENSSWQLGYRHLPPTQVPLARIRSHVPFRAELFTLLPFFFSMMRENH